MYNTPQLDPDKRKAETIITEVFNYLVAHPEALPRGHQERMGDEKLARVVCDYIAGMTDHYIEDLRKKLIVKKTP